MPLYRKCEKCGKQIYGWCKSCQINNFKESTNGTCGNEKINDLIQEMQSKIKDWRDIVFEWIPYNQFDNAKEVSKGDFATVYSSIWKNGPLHYSIDDDDEYTRNQNERFDLKYLNNSQHFTDEFLNKV